MNILPKTTSDHKDTQLTYQLINDELELRISKTGHRCLLTQYFTPTTGSAR